MNGARTLNGQIEGIGTSFDGIKSCQKIGLRLRSSNSESVVQSSRSGFQVRFLVEAGRLQHSKLLW